MICLNVRVVSCVDREDMLALIVNFESSGYFIVVVGIVYIGLLSWGYFFTCCIIKVCKVRISCKIRNLVLRELLYYKRLGYDLV